MNDKKTKENWIHEAFKRLKPTFDSLGFRTAGKSKYKYSNDQCEFRYLASIRHPRYSDDSHQMYLNPCIHVYCRSLENAYSKAMNVPVNSKFPTLGGSLGLYKNDGNMEEFPVDNIDAAINLVPKLQNDITSIAVPFWNALSTRSKILSSVLKDEIWAKRSHDWEYRLVVLIYLEEGLGNAQEFVSKNARMFKNFDVESFFEQLNNND